MEVERTEGSEHKYWLTDSEADSMVQVAADRSKKYEVIVKAALLKEEIAGDTMGTTTGVVAVN